MRPNGVEKQVRPKPWLPKYTPTVNTLLYLPFTEDMADHSGNNRVVTNDL